MHLIGYIRNTLDYGLTYSWDLDMSPTVYVDADYGGCRDTHQSTSGYVFMMAGGNRSSKCQATVALSTVKAEYVGMSRCAHQQTLETAMWHYVTLWSLWLGCNTGTGNSTVSQSRVLEVQVQFPNSTPKGTPQPITTVSQVSAVLPSYHQLCKIQSIPNFMTNFFLFWFFLVKHACDSYDSYEILVYVYTNLAGVISGWIF